MNRNLNRIFEQVLREGWDPEDKFGLQSYSDNQDLQCLVYEMGMDPVEAKKLVKSGRINPDHPNYDPNWEDDYDLD